MLARKIETQQNKLHQVSLQAALHPGGWRATIVSFSAEGCAIRTTARLKKGDSVDLSVCAKDQPVELVGTVVWALEDFRIDTFYSYGIQFQSPLTEWQMSNILDEDDTLAVQNGPLLHSKLEK